MRWAEAMKRPRLAGVFLFLGVLLVYLMLVRRHYSAAEPAAFSLPARYRPGPAWRPGSSSSSSEGSFQYGIMFDAGSTGTRIHIFKFQTELNEAPELAHETFRALQPGLSAYADDPEKCAAGIRDLLALAQSSVPPSSWTLTPVVLKATAGLRLLPGEKAEQLLDTVRALFAESPFLCREDSASIMDGTDEGISAWTTVNFLTGGLQSGDSSTVGMLDLGGGSTQITFSPQDQKTIQTSPIDYIRSFRMFNRTHTVYTHSYLGLGLMSARLAVLGGVEASPLGGSTELVSPCLAPESSGSWQHAEVVYTVRGQRTGEPVYQACRSKVEQLLLRKVEKAPEAADLDFYAFSYYYDRAVALGALEQETRGSIRVLDYQEAAERVCSGGSPSPPQSPPPQSPFLCLDLVYISVLLKELGFPPHKQLKLARTVHQVETSWALGATLRYLSP
ncbi:ectonucleoside triphosphate diphosphohydrolase 6 isoform X2 [Pseudoliparis swirei]|nr:ectonucleoside triphosphate diphosphohydrolase 6 isoform X2 [Pseudoliparis swirei]